MAEVGTSLFLGGAPIQTIQNNNFVFGNPFTEAGPTPQVRTDPYGAYIVTAQPMSLFTELGMTNYYDSIDSLVRGSGTNYSLIPSGSTSYYYPSASIVDSGSYDFSTDGYTTSVSQENSSNLGVIRTATNNIGSQNFVVEGWFKKEQAVGNPPYNMWIFGSDVSGDYLTMQHNNANTFTFWVNASNTWSITPTVTLTIGNWYHIAMAKSGTTVNVYLNGNRIGNGTRPTTLNTPPSGRYDLVGVNSGTNNDGIRKNVQDYRVYIGTDKGYTGATITVPQSIVELV